MKITPKTQRLQWSEPYSGAVILVEPGAGIGVSFNSIPEALAYCDRWGHTVENRHQALEAYARSQGWPEPEDE